MSCGDGTGKCCPNDWPESNRTVTYLAPKGLTSRIEAAVKDRLEAIDDKCYLTGWAIGYTKGSDCRVLSVTWTKPICQKEKLLEAIGHVEGLIPFGLRVVGIITLAKSEDKSDLTKLSTTADKILKDRNLWDPSHVPLLVIHCTGGASSTRLSTWTQAACALKEEVELHTLTDDLPPSQMLVQDLYCFRFCAALELRVFGETQQAVAAAVAAAEKDLLTSAVTWLITTPGSTQTTMITGNPDRCRALGSSSFDHPARVQLYHRTTGMSTAPSIAFQPLAGGQQSCHTCLLQLDVLSFASLDMTLHDVTMEVLTPAMFRQLSAMHSSLSRSCSPLPPCVSAFHFTPAPLLHPVSLVYPVTRTPSSVEEERLRTNREELHVLLGLPANRPLLRVCNALSFSPAPTAAGKGERLVCVHRGVPPSGVKGGKQHLVDGEYAYHHYMQDKFDDCGWGCAYRSLQTLCSWVTRQGYSSRPPPSHKEIQQTLVKLGDKSVDFIGSKQWIGAIELGYILDELFGMTCRVITVPSGDDIPTKARQLAHHFDTQGSPVMIGGGVLAYTLLGVDVNEDTGECAFLILDPHYTGADDIKKIQAGQWVAWKRMGDSATAGGELFVKDAFYNLLCPQRPNTV